MFLICIAFTAYYKMNEMNVFLYGFCSKMMNGFLQTESVLVTRKRLRESISRVSPIPVAQRLAKTIKRRKYSVPMGNSLWHMDGHMKLIR